MNTWAKLTNDIYEHFLGRKRFNLIEIGEYVIADLADKITALAQETA